MAPRHEVSRSVLRNSLLLTRPQPEPIGDLLDPKVCMSLRAAFSFVIKISHDVLVLYRLCMTTQFGREGEALPMLPSHLFDPIWIRWNCPPWIDWKCEVRQMFMYWTRGVCVNFHSVVMLLHAFSSCIVTLAHHAVRRISDYRPMQRSIQCIQRLKTSLIGLKLTTIMQRMLEWRRVRFLVSEEHSQPFIALRSLYLCSIYCFSGEFYPPAFSHHWHNRYDRGIPPRSWAGIMFRRHLKMLREKPC